MFEVQRAKAISIPEGEVMNIKNSSWDILWQKCEYMVVPQTDLKEMPVEAISVANGDVITVYYYLTEANGYVYDGSNCGCGSFQASSLPEAELNVHGAKTITATQSGKLIIAGKYSNYQWGIDWPGSLASMPSNRPRGDYIRIKIN